MSVHDDANADAPAEQGTGTPRRRRILFRCMALFFGLSVVLLLELICRVFGWGTLDDRTDPFVGFRDVQPLFVRSETGDRLEIAPARRKFFAVDSFPVEKAVGSKRIFCLGGSTVQGRPYSIETSFPTFLEIALESADPSHKWDVINCGGVSYASYRLVPILEECLAYEPDLIVLCTGHNEFLEDRSYDHLKDPSATYSAMLTVVGKSNLFWAMQNLLHDDESANDRKPMMTGEVDAMLDYHDSLKLYHRDDSWRDDIVAHYRFNVDRMVRMCRQAGVPLIAIRPPSNLGDSPPFKSESISFLSDDQRDRFRELLNEARAFYQTDLARAVERIETALEIDDRFALAWYELGHCLQSLNRRDEARQAFWRAREEDVCPLRMIAPLEEALSEVVSDHQVPMLDAFALLEAECKSGILDGEILVDHVHPSFRGHQLIAEALFEQLQSLALVDPASGWKEQSRVRFAEQLQSLDNLYYHNGQETLKALRGWAAGRAEAPPAVERFPHRASPD